MLLVGRSRSCRRPRALWFIIRSAACCSDSQSRKEERKEGRTGAGARARERRVRDLAGAQDVWKVDSALSVADVDANGGRGIPATMRLVPFATRRVDDAVIIGVEGASKRRGVEGCAFCSAPLRVPVSPSHWFYGYKWRRCRRSGESRAMGVSRVCPTIRLRSSRLWSPDAPFLSSNPL